MSEWKSFDTIPADVNAALVAWLGSHQVLLIERDTSGEWMHCDIWLDKDDLPTHWMPLPLPPKDTIP